MVTVGGIAVLAGELLMATPLRNQRSRLSFPRGLKETVEKRTPIWLAKRKPTGSHAACDCKLKQLDAAVVQCGV